MAANSEPTPEQIEQMRQQVAAYDSERQAAAKAERDAKLADLKAITGTTEYAKVLKDLGDFQATLTLGTDIAVQVSNSYSVLNLLKNIK